MSESLRFAALLLPVVYFVVQQVAEQLTSAPPLKTVETVSDPAARTFSVQFKDEVSPYDIIGMFVMPGESVELDVVFGSEASDFDLEISGGWVTQNHRTSWTWTAPYEPGLYPLLISEGPAGHEVTINAFVKVPFSHRSEYLNGYRIGTYAPQRNGDPATARPPGFVEVTPENINTPVSPNFTLGQFLCKQHGNFPKYLLVKERLLIKLETLLEEVNRRGIAAPDFHVMSAFRTPYYNRKIGNRTTYSQHLYGSAADIFVDTNGDGWMDDLTRSGRITVDDARLLAGVVEDLSTQSWFAPFIGGLGIYRELPHRGPFIHVDVRGEPARW